MKAESKDAVTGVNLLSDLAGKDWHVVETIDLVKWTEAGEAQHMLTTLEEAILYDERTQLP
eukprot:5196786-Prorocentrum_lima.AAC.1